MTAHDDSLVGGGFVGGAMFDFDELDNLVPWRPLEKVLGLMIAFIGLASVFLPC